MVDLVLGLCSVYHVQLKSGRQITIQCKSYSAQLRSKNIYLFRSSLSLSVHIIPCLQWKMKTSLLSLQSM